MKRYFRRALDLEVTNNSKSIARFGLNCFWPGSLAVPLLPRQENLALTNFDSHQKYIKVGPLSLTH